MGIYCDVISDRSLGTSTAKTQLSGDRSGNATDYVLPAVAKGILYAQPYIYETTPTANQSVVATLKIESDDLGIKDFEVFAAPISTSFGTNSATFRDLQRTAIYPLFFPCLGGEKMSFYGIPQTANGAAPMMGAMIWWTDDPRNLTQPPFRARVGGTAGGAGSGTSTGTATGSVTGATITLAGQPARTIRTVTGILANTTQDAAKPIAGWFSVSSPEISYIIRYAAEPVNGDLGTVTMAPQQTSLTRVDNLSVPVQPPSTISTALQVTAAPTTAGNFYQGIIYN